MALTVETTALPGVIITTPNVYDDERGWFQEVHRSDSYAEAGIAATFVQDNISHSHRSVLRGLHYQHPHAQGKLVMTLSGEIWDVAVDIRPASPTYREWVSVTLSAENRRQIFIPAGYAHGFCVLSDAATVLYKCSDVYVPDDDAGVRWDDPALAIDWPVREPVLSAKDDALPRLADISPDNLPT